jgi:hypothetical protein
LALFFPAPPSLFSLEPNQSLHRNLLSDFFLVTKSKDQVPVLSYFMIWLLSLVQWVTKAKVELCPHSLPSLWADSCMLTPYVYLHLLLSTLICDVGWFQPLSPSFPGCTHSPGPFILPHGCQSHLHTNGLKWTFPVPFPPWTLPLCI